MTYLRLFAISAATLTSCADEIDLDPLDETPPVESSVRPSPILGGTLTLTDDGLALAADPDRDLVHVVDLDAGEVLHTIKLKSGDQPHRIALGSDGLAHVVLRGAGGFATIDPLAGTVTARHALCSEPRGIAFKDADASLYVACAGGELLKVSEAGEVLERHELAPDLRDVLIVDGKVRVSQFRSAALLGLDGTRLQIPDSDGFKPHVAWRTWVTPSGDVAMLHQMASKSSVPINPDPEDIPEGGAPYGGGGGGCNLGIVNAALTIIDETGPHTAMLFDSNLTVDAAFSPDGQWTAMAVPGVIRPEDVVEVVDHKRRGIGQPLDIPEAAAVTRPGVRIDPRQDPGCFSTANEPADYGQVTAVAYTANGRLVLQSREPARLMVMDSVNSVPEPIALEGEARFDTGHEIFHRATDSGLSCASCHPEGTDDGHVWTFDGLGARRTQPLDVGLVDTAPYHWDGDMDSFGTLMAEVLAHRMGGKRQSPARADSFTRWIFEQQRPPANITSDAALAAAGEQLFVGYACSKCHDGPALGGQRTETIAGEAKQVPTLRRIALHPPYMHDGRSATLEDAVRDMIATTTSSTPQDGDIAAIAAYLRTL